MTARGGKVPVKAAALVLLACGAVAGIFAFQMNRSLLAQFDRGCRNVARSFAAASVDDLTRLDVGALRHRIGELREVETVQDVIVFDESGTVLTDGTADNPQRDQKTGDALAEHVIATRSWASKVEASTLRVAGPISGPDGKVAGFVTVTFVRAAQSEIAWRATVNGVLAAVACAVVGIVVLLLSGSAGEAAPAGATGTAAHGPAGTRTGGTSTRAQPGELIEPLLELASDAAALVDGRGDVVLVNGQLLALTGRRRDDLLGRPFWRLLGADSMSQAAFDDLLRRAAGAGVDATVRGSNAQTAVRLLVRTLGGQGEGTRRVLLMARRDGAAAASEVRSAAEAERLAALDRELEEQRASLEQDRVRWQEEKRAHEEARRKQETGAAAEAAGKEQGRKNELWAWAEEELKRVQARLHQSQQKIQQVEEELSSTIAARDLAERQRSRLEGEVERLQEEIQHVQAELARRPAEILGDAARRAEGERRRLVEELHHVRQERDRSVQEAKDSEAARRQLVEELRVAQDAQKRAAHLSQQAEQGRQSVESKLREVEADRERLAAELRALRGAGAVPAAAVVAPVESRPPAPPPPAVRAGSGESVIAATKEVPEGVIDRTVALAGVDGDVEFLCALIGIFLENCPRQLNEIKSAIAREDGETVERTARMLRGTVGNFGAREAGRAAQRLEEAAAVRDFTALGEACASLEAEIERLKPALGVLRQEAV